MRRLAPLLLMCLVALGVTAPAAAEPGQSEIREMHLWSAALQKTTNLTAILPPGFDPAAGPYHVLYLLHGSANEDQNGFGPVVLSRLVDDLAAYNVVGVLPDSGSGWTDARGPQPRQVRWEAKWPQENEPILGVNRGSATVDESQYTVGQQSYERYVLSELMPFVEAHLNVRRDRGGRGVFGHSGGAYGSFILGTRHPDVFSFVGGSSGPISWQSPSWYAVGAALDMTWGARDPVSDEFMMRARDPKFLAENLLGTGTTIMHSSGCVNATPALFDPTCNLEGLARPINDDWDAHATQIGLPHTYFHLDGADQRTHNAEFVGVPVYEQHFIPAAAATFADPPPIPSVWSYLASDRDFAVWGWRFHVDRPNNEFLKLINVTSRGFIARGTGSLVVETTASYVPDTLYRITTALPGGRTRDAAARAGADGRLRFTAQLGAPRVLDQQSALEQAGLFGFEDYAISITRDDDAASSEPAPCPDVWIYPAVRCDG